MSNEFYADDLAEKLHDDSRMFEWGYMECSECNGTNDDHDETCERWECEDCGTDNYKSHDDNCPTQEPYDYDDHALDEEVK